jgi:hypothetical protein
MQESANDEKEAPPARTHSRSRILAWIAECIAVIVIVLMYHSVTKPELYSNGHLLFPGPDGIEYGWTAFALNAHRSPMVAVSHELHPSRYNPIHPLFQAAYMFFDGHGIKSFVDYSEFAMIAAMLAFWIMLIGLGTHPLTRIGALIFVMLSYQSVRLGRSLMPESTMTLTLLVGAALAVWFARFAMREGVWERPRVRAGLLMMIFASAAFCAAPMSMRPSLLPFVGIPLLAIVLGVRDGKRSAPLIALVLGAATPSLLCIAYNRLVQGYWGLTNYPHWIGSVKVVSLDAMFQPSREIPFAPLIGERLADALVGESKELSRATFPAVPILVLLSIFSTLATRKSEDCATPLRRWFCVFAIFAFAVNLAFHLFYFFHDLRFHFMNFALLVAAGMIGGERLLRFAMASATPWVTSVGRIGALLGVFLISDLLFWPEDAAFMRSIARPPRGLALVEMQTRNAKRAGKVLRDFHVPMFESALPVAGARVLMKMEHHLHVPICPLFKVSEYRDDAHVVQFVWGDVGPPSGYIATGAPWDGLLPHQTWLIDAKNHTINEPLLRALIDRYGAVTIFYNVGDHNKVVPLLEWSGAQGIPVTNLKPNDSFGLYLIGYPK